MGVQKQGHWEQSKHQGRLFGDTKWDGKEFHGRERIDYGMCGTKGKSLGLLGLGLREKLDWHY
jgi:hypothetical protein